DVSGVARKIGTGHSVRKAGAPAKMHDYRDPAARPEILCKRLRVMAAAAALQAMEDDECRSIARLRELLAILVIHPAAGSRGLQLRVLPRMRADHIAVGEQP